MDFNLVIMLHVHHILHFFLNIVSRGSTLLDSLKNKQFFQQSKFANSGDVKDDLHFWCTNEFSLNLEYLTQPMLPVV